MKYTKEQLIEAQHQYNLDVCNDKNEKFQSFEEMDWTTKETAISQIEYLLSLVD